MTATVPGEQDTQLRFHATTATEFRELLGKVQRSAGLSCGQIAAKTGMPRSTAYSLPNTKRPGLPSNPDQVRVFVKACGLTEAQIDIVLDLWMVLQNNQESTQHISTGGDPNLDLSSPRARDDADKVFARLLGVEAILQDLHPVSDVDTAFDQVQALMARGGSIRTGKALPRHRTTLLDLVHYVVRHEDRTRRAVQLLVPIAAMVSVLVIGLVIVALAIPETAMFIVAAMAGLLITPVAWAAMRVQSDRLVRRRKAS